MFFSYSDVDFAHSSGMYCRQWRLTEAQSFADCKLHIRTRLFLSRLSNFWKPLLRQILFVRFGDVAENPNDGNQEAMIRSRVEYERGGVE